MTFEKRCVYILRSDAQPERYYTGLTSNVAARLATHNAGGCSHTATGRPWRIVVSIEFANEQHAVRFEKYLKSGSGTEFSKRHFR